MPTAVTSTNNPLHNQLYEERLRTLVPLSEIEARARNLFLTIDSDKDHSIDAEDMANYLKANGIFFNRKDFQDFMKRYDTNNSGSLDWLEYVILVQLTQ
jgi:Ca2+-binding EF-hand superfamily protein